MISDIQPMQQGQNRRDDGSVIVLFSFSQLWYLDSLEYSKSF